MFCAFICLLVVHAIFLIDNEYYNSIRESENRHFDSQFGCHFLFRTGPISPANTVLPLTNLDVVKSLSIKILSPHDKWESILINKELLAKLNGKILP